MTSFAVTGDAELRLDVQMGRVEVSAEDRDDIVVSVQPANPDRSGDRSAAQRVRVQRTGSAVVVIGPTRMNLFGSGDSVDVDVRVPVGCSIDALVRYGYLRVSGDAGSVRATVDYGDGIIDAAARLELRGGHGVFVVGEVADDADITFKSGTCTVRRVAGSLRVKGADGTIRIEDAQGATDISTSSGNVEIGRAGTPLAVRSAYGAVRIRAIESGRARVDGSYGAVDIGVRPGTAVWLDAASQHGTVRNELAADAGPGDDEAVLELRLRTGYGSIDVHRSEL